MYIAVIMLLKADHRVCHIARFPELVLLRPPTRNRAGKEGGKEVFACP